MKKLVVLITCAFLLTDFSFAQLVKQWDFRYGGSAIDEFHDIIQTSDGGYLVTGYSESGISGDKSQASQGSGDFWILKIDATGAKQWDKRYGGSNYDELFAAQQTIDGGYILGGWSNSGISGDKSQGSQGAGDYWVVKTDVNGIMQWNKTFGGSFEDYLQSIQQTSDGGYILSGRSNSGISGDKTQANRGVVGSGWDYWAVKINALGAKQWDQTYGGVDDDQLFSGLQTSDGGYIFGGYSASAISGEKSQASQGVDDYWMVKTDALGVKQWDKTFGGTNVDQLQTLIQTSDGGYLLGGGSASGANGDKSQGTRGNFDYWVVKTNSTGVKQWDKRFGGTSADNLFDLIEASDGGYLLGGASSSIAGGDKTQGNQGTAGTTYDYWTVKINSAGTAEVDKRFGGSGDDYAKAVIQTSDGGYAIGGWSTSGLSGDKSQASQGSIDYWVTKVSGPNSITTSAVASPQCAGSTINVSYTVTGTFTAGNTFTAQISDAFGNFTFPVDIGSVISTSSGSISATLPAFSTSGFNYQIQVISSNPVSQDIYPCAAFQIDVPQSYYVDADNDGYGTGTAVLSCTSMAGYVTDNTDCNDNDVAIHTLPFGAAGIISLSTNCEGSSGNLFDANTISQASSYQWILPAGLSSTFAGNVTTDTLISISFAIGTTTGTISVTGINSCGSGIDTANYFFTASPLPLAAGAITGDSIISACTHQSGITYSIAAITNATNYVWTLPATATIVGNADTTSILVNYSAYGISGTVSVYGTNSCGAGASSSLAVNYIAIPKAEICGITVDTTSQKGVLSWQRPLESYADSIVILRKNTSTLQYDRIATVDNVSPGAYLDASSSPNLRYETYKLAVKDSCGNIGDSSIAVTHKTIYLYGLLGWSNIPKLYWTAYEGISDTGRYYNVLRDSSGVGVFKIIEDSIPYNASLNYTDMNGAACLTCRYLIELVYSTDCDPSLRMMTSKSTSRSNVANRIAMPPDPIQTAVKNISTDEIKFSLQPNPAHENILISFQEAMKICSLELYNLIGEKIWSEQLAQVTYQTKQLISAEQLPRGAYLLKLASEKGISFRKIILN